MTEQIKIGDTTVVVKLYDLPLEVHHRCASKAAESATAEGLLKELLGPGTDIGHDPEGAPFLIGMEGHISISHCHAGVAVAYNPRRVIGIDIETQRPQLERVKARFLSPAQLADATTPLDLLDAWAIKEALYKALLTPGLPLTDIDLRDPRFNITTLHPAPGVALTLAVKR